MPSQKVLEQKAAAVDALAEKFGRAVSGILVQYQGITVEDDTKLRAAMRAAGVEYTVIKNSLIGRACDKAGFEAMKEHLEGMNAVAISYDDPIAPAKILKEYAEKKIRKLDRYFPEEADAFVIFSVEKKNRCVVELTIRAANGTLFRAQEENPDGDMRGAIDEAVSVIDRRIRKNKTRLAKNLRADALVPEVPAEFDVAEDTDFEVVRTKRFIVKPMSVDEAILQMNLLDHTFYVFRNVDDGEICVVYRRTHGGYGLIETVK